MDKYGWVRIPKVIGKELGIGPSTEMKIMVRDGTMILEPIKVEIFDKNGQKT